MIPKQALAYLGAYLILNWPVETYRAATGSTLPGSYQVKKLPGHCITPPGKPTGHGQALPGKTNQVEQQAHQSNLSRQEKAIDMRPEEQNPAHPYLVALAW